MINEVLHVFRNTPFGKEAYLQSIYFSKTTGMNLKVYIPEHPQFLMYFPTAVVTIDLDASFLRSRNTARDHALELARERDVTISFLHPTEFTASTLPDIPVDFGVMCCPRSISDMSTKITLGHIGPRVREIAQHAEFPVLIPTMVYKEWKRIVVFFGGSKNAETALRVGYSLRKKTGLPLTLFTYVTHKPRDQYIKRMQDAGLYEPIESGEVEWLFMEHQDLKDALYEIQHDALAVIGTYGHGIVKELLFGSFMESVQKMLPNNLLIVGPHCRGLEF